ncbi:MAG: B12-binding domain-containing radical SAM protein [Promethearchaeota archaeon]
MKELNKNLLFIIPGFFYIEPYQKILYYHDFPLSTLQLSSYLRQEQDINTDIIDLRLEEEKYKNLSQNSDLFEDHFNKVLEKYNVQNFNYIGINCYTSFQFAQTEKISKILKENYPALKIIVGGYHPTAIPEDFNYKNAPYDYIIRGEAEIPLKYILNSTSILRDCNPIILDSNESMDINELPFPDYDLYLRKYPKSRAFRIDLYFSRGCPYQCAFCADNYKFRAFKQDHLITYLKKIDSLVEKFNIQNPKIGFADQSFNKIPNINKILDYLIDNNYKEEYSMSSQSRLETIHEDPELIERFIDCGIIIGYGLESANKKLLVEMHKTTNPLKYLEASKDIINLYKDQNKIYCRLNILIGFPGETRETFDETVDFINKYAIHENIQISPSLFSNYPNVFVYKNMDYFERKFGTEFIQEWWKLNTNLLKKSIPIKTSSNYTLRHLIEDYKDKYISILKHFKHDTFANLVKWKQFYNRWHRELSEIP